MISANPQTGVMAWPDGQKAPIANINASGDSLPYLLHTLHQGMAYGCLLLSEGAAPLRET